MELTRGVLVTGADGQLGEALREEFGDVPVVLLTQDAWDVTLPPPSDLPEVDVALHTAAVRRVGRAEPALGLRPHEAQAEAAAGEDAWIVRRSGLFGPTGTNFVHTMLRLGAVRDEVAVVDDQRTAPAYVGHLAAAVRQLLDGPSGLWHLAADGDCTRAEFAEAIFEPGSTAACGASPPPRWDVRRRDRRTPSSAASGTTR